ncbi:N-carbamoylputrescine amidase [Caedibacter taeniospiralis]|jgi:N-carbamoylputrescine amidase|uniref:N-carbamoylputrescine amidase n=1 Tax=Caedibacter taeniospiralis TaxID=28907 RepID=UPI0037C0B8E6
MSSKKVTVAAIQMSMAEEFAANIEKASRLVEQAASQGANIILLPELFKSHYFCKNHNPKYFSWAESLEDSSLVRHFAQLAQKFQVVLPVSFFEKKGNTFFNSLAIADADGKILGVYRKSHIPDGFAYSEKYYFSPGKSGFKVWKTKYAAIGCGICWDQWFPETARCMVLDGAELLFYPTAIGSEPQAPDIDSQAHWQVTMQGHAGANMVPVIVANRYGYEVQDDVSMTFYGSSFITDNQGQIVKKSSRDGDSILIESFDLNAYQEQRNAWGMFRDRRPELYARITDEA